MAPTEDDDSTRILPPSAAAGDAERTLIAPPPAGDGNALPLGTRLGEFELTRVLGEGGFGIVYLAQDHSLHRKVALKEYMPSSLAARRGATQVSVKSERYRETFELGLKSFINEARLLAQFDHASLVKVYRFWEANGTAYMVMPFYEGITLKDQLRQMAQAPDEAWLLRLLTPLTEALAVIHAERCYHRDIAPDNIILLAHSGRPLLLDFGAARRVIGDMTQALTVILKPGYAPIEQYAEVPHMKQGAWTDVYALAAVVYYAITGKTPPASVGRMMGDSYVPLAQSVAGHFSERFLTAIDQALKVKPEERTQSVDELRAQLGLDGHAVESQETLRLAPARSGAAPAVPAATSAALGNGGPPTAPPRPATTPPDLPAAAGGAPRSRTGLWVGAGAALLVAGGAGLYLAQKPGDRAAAPAPSSSAGTVIRQPSTPPSTDPAASPAAAAPAPAPMATQQIRQPAAPFSIPGEFERAERAQTPGFAVVATPARTQLRIGKDRLAFSVTSARDGYVYVLVHGPDGSLTLLHPSDPVKNNRIRAGQKLNLPTIAFDTTPPTGAENFLVIVSEAARDFSAVSTRREYSMLVLPTGAQAEALAGKFSGRGSALIGRSSCVGADCDAYGAARFSVDVVR